MKLRIHGNSMRIRLTQSEVRDLSNGKVIEQMTDFALESRLITRVESSPDVDSPTATFDGHRLTLTLPINQIREWAKTDQVGIEASQSIGNGQSLRILIEKDFDCLHPRPDENVDTFPNPKRSGST